MLWLQLSRLFEFELLLMHSEMFSMFFLFFLQAKQELTMECDYVREAENQRRFRELLADDPNFVVPAVAFV